MKHNIEVMARGVCQVGNQLLVCQTQGADITYLPGGHIDFDEPAKAALEREIREELNLESHAGRFLGVVEHSFIQKGELHCEINLVFALEIPSLSADVPPASAEGHLTFHYLPMDALDEGRLEPSVLCRNLPDWLAHDCQLESWLTSGLFARNA